MILHTQEALYMSKEFIFSLISEIYDVKSSKALMSTLTTNRTSDSLNHDCQHTIAKINTSDFYQNLLCYGMSCWNEFFCDLLK